MLLVSHGEKVVLESPQGTLPVFLVRGRFCGLSGGGASASDPLSRATNLLEGGVAGVELLQRVRYGWIQGHRGPGGPGCELCIWGLSERSLPGGQNSSMDQGYPKARADAEARVPLVDWVRVSSNTADRKSVV